MIEPNAHLLDIFRVTERMDERARYIRLDRNERVTDDNSACTVNSLAMRPRLERDARFVARLLDGGSVQSVYAGSSTHYTIIQLIQTLRRDHFA